MTRVREDGGFSSANVEMKLPGPSRFTRRANLTSLISSSSERRARDGDSDGQREAQEGSQAADNLLQLPAGGPPEEIPVGPVLGPAGEGRAGRAVGPDADTGEPPAA